MDLTGKTILITGATGALGSVAADTCASTGANLVLTARSATDLTGLAARLTLPSERLLIQPADLTNPVEVANLVADITTRWGRADILLHTTGGWAGGKRLGDLTDADWQTMLALNLQTTFNINRAVLPYMLAKGW